MNQLHVIGQFLDDLQDKYSLNDFSPTDIILSKNGDTLFAKVKDNNGNGEIILHRWKLQKKDEK
jgi:hypothetical protein